jgi:hypothetical protein
MFSSNFITGERWEGHVTCVCDSFSWESCSRKETTEKSLVHAGLILNKMCGWIAEASESEQAELGRMETNPKELDELIKHRNIINCVKAQSLIRFGHINRMAETSIVKNIYKWKPFTRRPVGRPKS